MKNLELSPRLRLLAGWVHSGARVADVGTDHAYLPVWLVLHGRVSSAIASDLREGPLARARETGRAYGAESGENIAAILAGAPWTADGAHTLLLQPQTRAEVLRQFLSEHGYRITHEALVRDRGILYPCMEVTAGQETLSPGQLYGGAKLLRDPLGEQYIIAKIIRLQSAVAGLNRAGGPENQEKADALREILTALLSMREEWRHANCP